jgi:hypothetical protein
MNFINKIFTDRIDSFVHINFQRFSRGEFKNKAIIEAKRSVKGEVIIKTSYEFANDLVNFLAKILGENKTRISGCIVSTRDLTGKIDFKEKKQFQGVKRYIIDKELSGKEINLLIKEFPKNFFALSFEFGKNKLKIKPKAPTSGKSKNNKEDKASADFCILKTSDEDIIKNFIFEKGNFKKAFITHDFLINEIKIPENLKEEKDFAKIRENSIRCGRIIRKAIIDEKDIISEKDFCA